MERIGTRARRISLVEVVCRALKQRGVETDELVLRDVDLGFCLNCRACTQPGEVPGECVLRDAMGDIVRRALNRAMPLLA